MTNSPDAVSLMNFGGLSVIENENELYNWLSKIISDESYCNKSGMINKDYIYNSQGASQKISDDILEKLF